MEEMNDRPAELWRNKRVKTPTVLQMEAVECGAASLAMILGYFGRIVPLDVLRADCGVSRDGSKASNVLKAARKYGLEAKGFRKEPEELNTLRLPMILFWNFNHFLILEGIKKRKVYLNDPASGRRTISLEEYDQSFTGVVLTFEPGPEFRKGGEKRSLFSALESRLSGSGAALVYALLAGLFLVIPGLVTPTFSKVFMDNILVKGMSSWLKPLLVAMAITAALSAALTWWQKTCLLRLETKLALSSSARFFRHVFMLPIDFFAQRFGGEIGNRVMTNDKVALLLSGDLATNALNLVMIVFYAAVMFQFDVLLTLVGIASALLNLGALQFVSRKRVDVNQRLLQEQGKLLGTTMSGLQMIETLKATGAESDFFSQWSGYQAKMLNAQQELAVSTQYLSVIPTLLAGLNTVAILSLGAMRVMDGYLTLGMLLAFQMLMTNFTSPVKQIVDLGSKLQETEGDMCRLDDVFNYPVDRQTAVEPEVAGDAPADSGLPKLSGYIELKDITFGYSKLEAPLIQGFNLTVKPGARVALVGGTGSGKSTIAKLVTGLYEPWEGEILLDGKPRRELPRRLLTNSIALVDQDILLFGGTVRDNLTLWDRTLPENIVLQAAKDACIHEDITARSEGYESILAEGGSNLSGGQRQRIEIARALAIRPTVLVLDEATAALDATTEKVVDDNIRRRGCTCLIIAHRLSTIRDCDEIIVLERGKVVQRGAHDEMKNVDGPYANLIKSQ